MVVSLEFINSTYELAEMMQNEQIKIKMANDLSKCKCG